MWVLLEMTVNILSIRENRRLGPSGNTFPQWRPVVTKLNSMLGMRLSPCCSREACVVDT